MKSLTKLSQKAQRGYSLIELSIALAIVGVVIAGSIVGVQAILTSNNVNKTIKQTNWAVGKVVSKLVRDSDWSRATNKELTTTGMDVWPDTDVTSAGQSNVRVTHYLGGQILVAPVSTGGTGGGDTYGVDTNQGLVYTLTGIPVGGCADLAAGLEGVAVAMSIKNQSASEVTSASSSLVVNDVIKDNKPNGTRFSSNNVNSKCNGLSSDGSSASGAVGTATISMLIQRR